MPSFDIGAQSLGGTGGLLVGLDPGYQAKQLANQAAQLDLKRATAFQGGVPTTDGTPNGPIDFDAIAKTQIQNGDVNGGVGLLSSALKLNLLRDPSTISNPTGQGAGASSGGLLTNLLTPPPGAGGGNYGQQPTAGPGGGISGSGGTASGSGDPLDIYAHSIGALESNNRYDALGQKQANGAQAIGRYQVMSTNVGPWTQEVLGHAMDPQQFLASPQAQDAVFRAKFGQSLQQYSNPYDAASVWFSGRPLNRAGNATDSLGTTVPAYIQKFASGLGPAAQAVRGGQAAGQPPMPGQAQPVPPGGSGAAPSLGPTSADPLAAAQARLAAQQNADLSTLTAAQNAQRDADIDAVQSVGPTSSGGTTSDAQVAQARKTIQATSGYAPESLAPGAQQALAAAKNTVSAYLLQQNTPGGASPGTVRGQPVGATTETPPVSTHPFGQGSNALQGSRTPPPGAGGASPGAPMNAVAPAAAIGVARPPVLQPTSMPGQGGAPAIGAAPSSGPDLPYLQGKYAAPGGGPQYVTDLLDKARRYALGGEPQAAQAFQLRATQVQNDLMAVNKAQLDLQTHNAELTPELKNYQQAVQQGFQGSALDYLNAVETQKANATAAGRNAVLTPGQKEYGQAVAGGFQGSEADYQAAAAGQKGEAEGQGKYLGTLPAAYAKTADAARATSDTIDQMLSAAQGFRMGAGSDAQQNARKVIQGAFGVLGVQSPALNDPTASFEDFNKMAGVLNRTAAQQVGGRTGVQEMQLIGSTLPSPEMSYDGFRSVASSLKGSGDYAIAKQQAAQDWTADPAHKNSLSGFEASFNRNTSPAAFWLNRLRVDQPDLFQQTVQGLGQTDQGRALLQKAKAGMAWANSNGLFN